jgi:hypothetical protein
MTGIVELVDGNWLLRDQAGNEYLLGAEATPPYAEPGMTGTVELVDGHWIIRDDSGLGYIVRIRDNGEYADASFAYAEPGMSGTISLVDGLWLLKDDAGFEYLLGAEASPTYIEPGMEGTVELVDGHWLLRDGAGNEYLLGAEVFSPYAEPGMIGTIELVDGHWVLRDGTGNEYLLGAEVSPPYAEPGMIGTVELVDGHWLLRDGAGNEYLLGVEVSHPYAEPGMAGTIELVDGHWVLRDGTGNEYLLGAEVFSPYAEPGMIGTIELVDGHWVLRDGTGNEYLLGAEVSTPYAEPGMIGTVELVDGHWLLRDGAGNEYLLGAEVSPPYAEPGMIGTIELVDGHWVLRDGTGNEYLLGAEVSSPYAEPGMAGTIELVDGHWVLRDGTGNEYLLGAEVSPLYAEPGMIGTIELVDGHWVLRDGAGNEYLLGAEVFSPYAEPGMIGTIELVDGHWVLRDGTGNEYLLGAEVSPPYAEPGMIGTIELVDGHWVLRDGADATYLIPVAPEAMAALLEPYPLTDSADASIPYAEPGMAGTIELVDGHWVLRDGADATYLIPVAPETMAALLEPYLTDSADVSIPYAEPGMRGTIALVEGHWVLKDSADATYLIPVAPEAMAALLEPYLTDSADASIPYAEPGMSGTIELVEGHWTLKDSADTVYLIPFLQETVSRLQEPFFRDRADTVIPYAEPGMSGTIALVEGYWILKDDADTLYLLSSPQEALARLQEARMRDKAEADSAYTDPTLLYLLTGEPRFPDRPEAQDSLPYIEVSPVVLDSPRYLPENEAQLRKIYETILRLETAPNRPPEIIMDLGPVGKELYSGKAADEGSASLLLIKNLSSGKYYLQIGLFDRREALARKLTGLNWVYPYALESTGTSQSPSYKLLVGPVNEGESNALLLRFKRYGYHDAFIRREG